jgi:DNA-binding winged helix-turn-helix (wHTH) protein/Tol biopolymer transport system component
MQDPRSVFYQFDGFQLDLAKRRLLRNGEVVPLKPKAFDLLAVLIENNGQLKSKDELLRLVWGEQIVEETNLSVSISAIRRALGEKASEPRYITNVSGRGYYFSAILNNEEGHDLLLESRTISRIVVERDDEEVSVLTDPAAVRSDPLDRSYVRRSFARNVALAALSVVVVVGLIATIYIVFFRKSSNAANPFQDLSVIRLTTTGRATKAALSHDGKLFVFVQQELDGKQSLWLSHVDGSGQVQLRPPAERVIVNVAFSADANRIFYVQFESNASDRGDLYRMPVLGGVPEKIKEGVPSRVTFSPDGKRFAFVQTRAAERRMSLVVDEIESPIDREIAVIPFDQGRFLPTLGWSPDGKSIAGSMATVAAPEATKIFVTEISSNSIWQMADHGWNIVQSIVWTKGSDGLVVVAGKGDSDLEKEIWYVPYPYGEPQRILADSNSYQSLDISANNSTLLAIQTQTISNVWVAPANDLAAAKQITSDMLGKQAGWNGIDWTEDGHIIYSGRVGKSDTIWEMNADGTGQHQLIPENRTSNYLSLPDDGKTIVFASNRSGSTEIWKANRDGSGLMQLTTGGGNKNPHVAPNGEYVIYTSGRDGVDRLCRLQIGGGQPVVLIDKLTDWARVSPDSKLIAGEYDENGKRRLVVIAEDGRLPVRFFDVPPTANFRLGVRWTPDGKSVTYRDWLSGIWKQDIDGGVPVRLIGLPAEKLFAYAWSRDGRSFAFGRGAAINDVVLLSTLK